MPDVLGRHLTPAELRERVGSLDQWAGVDRLRYAEGPEQDVEILRFRSGAGFDFDLVPSRGLDLAGAWYKGVPLAYLTPMGVPHPAHFEPPGLGFARTFFAGLLTTCGLLYSGAPGADPGHDTIFAGVATEDSAVVKLGLHGRVNVTPARHVSADAAWEGDQYVLTASGRIREAVLFGENVELERRVRVVAGAPEIALHDRVTNHGHRSEPLMMLYHCNFGWPLVDDGAVVVTGGGRAEPRDDTAAAGLPDCLRLEAPQAGYAEQVFFHHQRPDAAGLARCGIVNRKLGIGVGVTYHHETLPELVQWKMMGQGTYVCGLEPANCRVMGRAAERAAGRLRRIEPGQTVEFRLAFRVLDGAAAIDGFEAAAAGKDS